MHKAVPFSGEQYRQLTIFLNVDPGLPIDADQILGALAKAVEISKSLDDDDNSDPLALSQAGYFNPLLRDCRKKQIADLKTRLE